MSRDTLAISYNGTFLDTTFVQDMLMTVVLHLLYMFVVSVDAISFFFSRRTVQCFKQLYHRAKKEIYVPLKVPEHMAIALGSEEIITLTQLCDFITYAAQYNVKRITFYDRSGRVEEMVEKLERLWYNRKKAKNLAHSVHFDHDQTSITQMASCDALKVNVISARHGKEAMVSLCKSLGPNDKSPLTRAEINRALERMGVYEVDFLVVVGRSNTLEDYPPWALRAAEIQRVKMLHCRRHLRESTFRSLLRKYSERDRRLGC